MLRERMDEEFGAAKTCWAIALIAEVIATALTVLGIVKDAQGRIALALGVLGLAVPILVFVLRLFSDSFQSHGEKIRLLLLLQDGLGRQPSAVELLSIGADSAGVPAIPSEPLRSYYDSKLPPGPHRLAHISEEAAYYTRAIAGTTARICAAVAIVGIVGAFLLVWVALQSGAQESLRLDVAKIASTVVVFFAAGQFASMWWNYAGLARAAHCAFKACDSLRDTSKSLDAIALYAALGPYDAALAKAPPLPLFIYRLRRATLDRNWSAIGSGA